MGIGVILGIAPDSAVGKLASTGYELWNARLGKNPTFPCSTTMNGSCAVGAECGSRK
jgi:hypothetical protein